MSIKKIAEKVGTSPATVSRVLNNPNYHCADSDLRERIWNAVMEMNYRPNEAAENTKPMLTTVRLPKEEMGKFAILCLIDPGII